MRERFWSHVDTTGECWEWTASRNEWGYGQFSQNGKRIKAHRWAYLNLVGPVPKDRILMHTCDNPGCVSPEHLRIGTNGDNHMDMRLIIIMAPATAAAMVEIKISRCFT